MTNLRHFDDLLRRSTDYPGHTVGDVDSVPDMADLVAARGSEGQTAFGHVAAATHVEVGTTETGKARLQVAAPGALGDLQVDPATGRPAVYADGDARQVALEHEAPPLIARMGADASASSETTVVMVDSLPYDAEIYAIRYRPHASVGTTLNPHVGQMTFGAIDEVGDPSGASISANTIDGDPNGLGTIDAFAAFDFTMSALPIAAGHALVLTVTKEGDGYQFPEGTFAFRWRRA